MNNLIGMYKWRCFCDVEVVFFLGNYFLFKGKLYMDCKMEKDMFVVRKRRSVNIMFGVWSVKKVKFMFEENVDD